MELTDLAGILGAEAWQTANRHLRLRWNGELNARLGPVLLPQRVTVREGINTGVEMRISCFLLDGRLALKGLLGHNLAFEMLTDEGTWRTFPGIVTEATAGRSDGAVRIATLIARDPLSIMGERKRLRVFTDMSVLDVASAVLDEWRRSGSLGSAFNYTKLTIESGRYPRRGHFIQFPDESDAAFLQRLLYPSGISCTWRAEAEKDKHAVPRHELLLFDDGWQLPAATPTRLRYLRQDVAVLAEGIELLAQAWCLVPDGVAWSVWDHESAATHLAQVPTRVDQGASGARLGQLLLDTRLTLPHLGNDSDDRNALARVQAGHHVFRSHGLRGRSNVRTLAAGTHAPIDDFPAFEGLPVDERDYIFVQVEHWAMNNLPGALHEATKSLFDAESVPRWVQALAPDDKLTCRYSNRFSAVHRGTPIVPVYDAQSDAICARRLTGLVVASDGEITADGLGRCKVRLVGAEAGRDTTAWIRHVSPWAGRQHGFSAQLRVDTEVDLQFLGHDRLVIVGCHYNGETPPPLIQHQPSLPANRHQTALLGREIGGTSQQHLLLDDTSGQQMLQLATDVGSTALNLGCITTPRHDGAADLRGQGAELRSDTQVAVRSAMNMLLTTWKRRQASGPVHSAQEHVTLMQDCLDLFKSLGQYAAEHQGLPVDEQGQRELKADVDAASGSQAKPQDQTPPTISITAPAGIATTTPQTLLSYAGVNLDSVAMQHLQFTAGQRCNVNAGKGISMFSHDLGITAIAHHGKWLLQSQHDDTQVDSGKDIKLSALGRVVASGQDEVTLMVAGGAYIKLAGGDVEIGGPGALVVKTAGHYWDGPASMTGDLPTFGASDLGRIPRLLSAATAQPVPDMKLHVARAEGDIDGQSDASGQGPSITADGLHRLQAYFLDNHS